MTTTANHFDSYAASKEYFSRPADEEFRDLDHLISETQRRKDRSEVIDVDLCTAPIRLGGGDSPLRFKDYPLTPWAFQQLCARLSAPSDFLRQLSAPTMLQAIQERQEWRARQDDGSPTVRCLVAEPRLGGAPEIRAVLTPRYTRVWDADLFSRVRKVAGNVLQPAGFLAGMNNASGGSNAGISRASAQALGMKQRSGIYSSDRNTFAFLVNPSPLPGPDGGDQLLYRGSIIGNSETGERKCFAWFFAFDSLCSNHIIWGASKQVTEVAFRHIGKKAVEQGMESIERILETWLAVEPAEEIDRVLKASKTLFIDAPADKRAEKREEKLRTKGFQVGTIEDSLAYSIEREKAHGTDPYSVWGTVCGLTRAAQDIPHAGDRLDVESKASKLLLEC